MTPDEQAAMPYLIMSITLLSGLISFIIYVIIGSSNKESRFQTESGREEILSNEQRLQLLKEKRKKEKKENGVIVKYEINDNGTEMIYKIKANNPYVILEKMEESGYLKYFVDNCYHPRQNDSIKLISTESYIYEEKK